MATRPDNLTELWKKLKPRFDRIFNVEEMTKAEHQLLYDSVYSYCTASSSSPENTNKITGLDLYKKLRSYFKQYVQSLKSAGESKTGVDLLTFFEEKWTNFRRAARNLSNTCHHLNRNWVKTTYEEGQRDIVVVFAMALLIWKDDLFIPCSWPLMSAFLNEVEKERNGGVIATTRLRTIIDSLVDLCVTSESQGASSNAAQSGQSRPATIAGLQSQAVGPQGPPVSNTPLPPAVTNLTRDANTNPVWRGSLPVYRDYFEQQFLLGTVHYYQRESEQFLKTNSITDYLKRVGVRLEEERRRASTYLHISTLPELLKVCEQSLIGDHIETLAAEFPNLLMENRVDDLARMYTSLSRFAEGESRLVSMMETHVDKVGSEALKEVCQTATNNPKLFVDTIIGVQRRHKELLAQAFANNAAFTQAFDKGCERFINRNAVTELAGNPRKSPELLAKYADLLLKKSTKEAQPDDLGETLNNVMEVFKYVEDKDVFQKFYSNMLARRLVNNMSVSEDAEAQMISLLKGACGFEYTSKLQRMFQDVSSSRELASRFNEWTGNQPGSSANLHGVDLGIMVLSSNAWPFTGQTGFTIPQELGSCLSVFGTFYQSHHEGRKLAWCYQLSRGEVVTHYTKIRHTFQVSTYQMSILMLYNTALSYTVGQLQSETGIELSMLTQLLSILLKGRILRLDGDGGSSKKSTAANPDDYAAATGAAHAQPSLPALTPDTALHLYTDYNNKRIRVNLNVPVKSETRQESEATMSNVESDRKLSIQACIVRIMKTRKTMKHEHLTKEVIEQMSSRFSPAIPLIKQCINSLIEREFIKRHPSNLSTYEYIA